MVSRPAITATDRRGHGFTLIELLVVIVIIGIVSAIVLLSLGLLSDDRALRQEARRMASLIELAADEAVLQGRDFGVEFTTTGYRFVEHDPYLDQWHEIPGDDLLRQRSLPESLRFELTVEDRPVILHDEAAKLASGNASDDDGQKRGAGADYAPHAFLLSSGEISPVHVAIFRSTDRQSVTLDIDPGGDIEIEDNAEAAR